MTVKELKLVLKDIDDDLSVYIENVSNDRVVSKQLLRQAKVNYSRGPFVFC